MGENALLIGIKLPYDSFDNIQESMNELSELARTAGTKVIDIIIQPRKRINSKYYIGKGKLEEIHLFYDPNDLELIIFNNELTPAQAKNISKELNTRVITRTELILNIFAMHAHTKSASLQVELAQLKYKLPRVIGKGTSMSRLEGRVGMRGPGEQQLEYDRRYLRNRINLVEKKIENLSKSKDIQRKKRLKEFKIAIIGYTNSGKSTLIKRLVKADVLIQDKLFATLNTTTRKLWLGDSIRVLITDTVGFIRDIPHSLIESFRSTLEDTLNAQLLLHIVDISSSNFKIKIQTVHDTIEEIGGRDIPLLICFNKIDLLKTAETLKVRKEFPKALYVSAKNNININALKDSVKQFAEAALEYR